jgi:carbon-monoxide dehydrogenase large subunit
MRHRVRIAGETGGRLRAADIAIVADLGAYPHNGARLPALSSWVAQGAYDLDRLRVRTSSVVTNCAPTGSYRGAGRPEAAYAIERAVEVFAAASGVDPVTVRRASLIPTAQSPYRTRTGALYDSGDYVAAMERALELVGADEVRRERQTSTEDGTALGVGVAVFIERAGGQPDLSEYARVELTRHGPVARRGTADSGQGHATVWSNVAADVLGGDPDDVTVITGDTDELRARSRSGRPSWRDRRCTAPPASCASASPASPARCSRSICTIWRSTARPSASRATRRPASGWRL